MVNPTPTSFYTDGGVYDEADVVSNDTSVPAGSTVPSSFFSDGGVVGEGVVVSNETLPGPNSTTPSSFFADGAIAGEAVVVNNDTPPSGKASTSPSSFYPNGNVYDYLSQESEVVALLQQLADTTTTNANAAATSASNAKTSETNAATSASNAATAVQGAAGTATPIVDGTAAVGTSTHWAHEDHVHPTDTSRAAVTYVDAAVAPKADKTYVDTQDALKADKTYVDTQDATKADKTYVDTQDATKADRATLLASIPVGQCRFVYTNSTTLTLKPYNGNNIKINGAIYSIPAAGISISNAGLGASFLYYCYAIVTGGVVSLIWDSAGHSTSATAGNVGVEIKTGDDTRTLVGMARTDASGAFMDDQSHRLVRSWFNDTGITFLCTSTALVSTSSAGTWVELDAGMRTLLLGWAGENISATFTGFCTNSSAGQTTYQTPFLDGAVAGLYGFQHTAFANYYQCISTPYASFIFGSDTMRTLSLAGQVGAGTASWSCKIIAGSTVRK